jgi:hypothetical protein
MTLRLPLTLPPYTPTSWELKLPGYPVITGTWRSSSYPEILGSLPTDSEWSLRFENVTSDRALELMLPWRATGGGQWPLTSLPDELAGGVDDASFRKRLTGTIWTIADKPQKESVKNGRFNVTIRLIYELTFDSVYGPGNPVPPQDAKQPVRLNISNVLTVAGLAIDFIEIFDDFKVGIDPRYITTLDGKVITTLDGDALVTSNEWTVLPLNLSNTLTIAALATGLDQTARLESVGLALVSLNLPNTLSIAGTVSAYDPAPFAELASGPVVTMGLSASLSIAGTALIGTDIPVNSITYEQSSTFPGTFAADNPSMTDKTLVNLGAATDLGNPAWIEMNLGRNYGVAKVIIGTATSNIPGSWNKSFTENKIVEYSSDRSVWTTAFNTGTFAADGIYTFNTNFTARYIRIRTTSNDYVALSEFYALGAGQTY